MLDTSLDIALEFLAAHPTFYIFPIQRLEKLPPLVKPVKDLASNDPKQIKAWHAKWRGCNWGVSPEKSGIVPLDVDTKPGKVGLQTLDDLLLNYGDLPDTFTVRSPSGGLHYYFAETDVVKYRFALGKAGFGTDLDSPAYLLIPGCVTCSNIDQPYKIINDVPVAPAPAWFAEYLKEKPKPEPGNADYEAVVDLDQPAAVKRMITFLREGAPNSIMGQGGDKTMFDVICVLKDEGISEAKALELLTQFYNVPEKCVPLWTIGTGPEKDRLDVKVRNVYTYARENKAGSATAEFAFGDEADRVDPAEVAALAASWAVRDRAEREKKNKARTESLLKEEASIDPLTGEPWADGQGPEGPEDPTPAPTKPKKKRADPPPNDDDPGSANDGTDDRPDTDDDKPKGKEKPLPWIGQKWVWVVGIERFVRIRDSRMWSRTQFDSRYNNLAKVASISGAIFKAGDQMKRFDSACFRPGQAMELGPDFNLWRPSPIVPEEGDTNLWNEHLNYLFQNPEDKDHVLNWLAWVYQNQGRKPNHALLIVGKNTGTGKSFIARVMEQLIGQDNTQRPKNSSLKGDFNGWALRCKLCIIEELMQIGRREVANELRDIITEPTIEVNIKNVPAQLVENYMAMMGISNHPDALPIDETDRRWLVVSTPVTRRDPEYYRRLFEILNSPKALAAIAHELQTRKLGDYDASQAAPFTDAKREMIELSRSEVETWLYDNISNAPMSHRLFTIQDIQDTMPPHLQKSARITTVITNFVKEKLDGSVVNQIRLSNGKRARLWAKAGPAKMMQDATPAKLVEIYDKDRKAGVGGRTSEEQAVEDFGTE